MRFPRILFALLASLTLAACGGGGSSGGGSTPPAPSPAPSMSVASLTGNYTMVMSQGAMPRTMTSFLLRGTSDAAGTLVVDGHRNEDGAVSVVNPLTMTYTVAADGVMTLSLGNILFARGGLSADGARAVLGTVAPIDPGIVMLLRTEGTYSPGSLRGNLRMGDFARMDNNPVTWSSALGSYSFDGNGSYTGQLDFNQEGATASLGLFNGDAYTVNSTGKVDISFGPMIWSGQLAAGGQYGILGGDMTGNGFPVAMALVKNGANMGLANLEGAYWMARLDFNGGAGALQVLQGTLTASSTGALTIAGETNNGSGALLTSETATASVAANGDLVINRTGVQELLSGALSPDGAFGFVAGGLQPNSESGLWVLVRR